jgi:hypothetical protein
MKMTLKQWLENSWLRQHKTKPREITDLLQIVARDLEDAGKHHISSDWRFGIAYNAALKLCTILLYAEGYRSERTLRFVFQKREKNLRFFDVTYSPPIPV